MKAETVEDDNERKKDCLFSDNNVEFSGVRMS
jgi:hypothetical protein